MINYMHKLMIQFQGYNMARFVFFSASVFFILLLFSFRHPSFLNSTYNSYSVMITLVDKIPGISDPRSNIYNSSTTILTSSKSSTFEVVDQDNNNATEIKTFNLTIKTDKFNVSEAKNNSLDVRNHHKFVLKMNHNLSTLTVTSVSTSNESRHNPLEEGKRSQKRTDDLAKSENSAKLQLRRLVRGQKGVGELESRGISCDSSDFRLDLCVISRPIALEKQKNSLNIYTQSWKNAPNNRVVRPYPKKEDPDTMNLATTVNILQGKLELPHCDVQHSVPALVFSFGGFTDNNYHKFSEVLIPLFVTSRHFESRVQFVVTDNNLFETSKFSRVLKHLSSYEVIDAYVGDNKVHCFPSAIVGLRYFDNLNVNETDTPGGYTMANFRALIRESYDLKVASVLKPKRPKVLLISRSESRTFLNEDKMVTLIEKFGFRVQKVKPHQMSNLDKLSKIVNSCDMMVGVHGAGLTNEIFLPDGAVVVQIVPLGLEWGSEQYFEKPTQRMGLKYLEYKIDPYESSLYDLYGPNDPIVCDTASIWARGYGVVKEMYLERQHIRIDLAKFRNTLVEATKLLQ